MLRNPQLLATMKSRLFPVLAILLFVSLPSRAEWQHSVTNYTRHTYEGGNQNWMLQQHENGWMYAANNNGLLEFDGVTWNLYPMRNAKVRAMKIADDGRIYIGGIGQFGYFIPNRLGRLDYVCLSDSLPSKSIVGVVWNILQNKGRIYFQSDRGLFYWENKKLTYESMLEEVYISAILYDKFYVSTAGGILIMKNKHFKLIPGSKELGRVSAFIPYKGKIFIVTRYNGLFSYDGETIQKFHCAADSFMQDNSLFCAALNRNLLVLGSVQGGACLLDLERDEMDVISINNGLQNKTVLSMTFDLQNDLWLGLDNGIDCIHLNSPVFSLYGNKSLIGSGYFSYLYQNKLYLGTNQGLYSTILPSELNKEIPMNFIAGTSGQIWSFLNYDNKLFCASDNGIFLVDGNKITHLDGIRGVRNIISLNNHPDVLIAAVYGKYSGLYLLQKKGGSWQVVCKLENFTYAAKSLMAGTSGNTLWITNKDRGICRLKLSDDLRKVLSVKKYNNKSFPSGYDINLAQVNNEMIVVSHYGLWRYNHLMDRLEEYNELERMLDGKVAYTYLNMDLTHNLWYVSGGALKLLRYDAVKNTYSKNSHDIFLKGSLIENNEQLSVYGEQAIVGTEEGFSLVRFSQPVVNKERISLQIRRVYLTGQKDSLIYGRSYRYDSSPVVIPYKFNSLRIEYSISSYDASQSALFSYRLSEGNNKGEWSEFSENSIKEFTGLHEGKYVFSVKLLTDKDKEPVVASFAFEILPPWYRSYWSIIIYIAAGCLLLFYIYSRIIAGRKRLLMQKELEIYRQKQEFKKESELKDQKIDSLKEEKLQAELWHKSEELIRTTLNIVRKNEMLIEIKKEVLGISHAINEENLVFLRRKTLRLLGQIDTNIEHDDDLQAFQTTFDSVHNDFFSRLEKVYPELNNRDKMLCAYVQMNLLSKEIAPLLNISERGVEISRYRLRKKLNLKEGESLVDFLQKFSK